MRMLICCAAIVYGGAAWDYTTYIKPSQPITLEQALSDGVPAWIGASERMSRAD